MILCVGFEMFREVIDAFAEDGYLDFGGAGVSIVGLVTANELCLAILGQRHLRYLHERSRTPRAPDAPYVQKILSRARSTCYIRTTEGCKSVGAVDGRAIATSAT